MRWTLPLLLLLAACVAPPEPSRPAERARTAGAPDLDGLDRLVAATASDARERRGVDALAWRDDLAAVAREHSLDMARRGYFDHVAPDGRDPQDRARDAEVECRVPLRGRMRVGVSENLYLTSRYRGYTERTEGPRVTRTYDWFTRSDLAARTVQGWLDSPGHRRNLLDPDALAHGIGVAVGTDDSVYITQVLC